MASRGQVYRRRDRTGFYARFKHQGRFVHRGGFTSEEAAADWSHGERRRLEREELLGVPTVPAEVTSGRFLPKWKEWAEGRWSPTTYRSSFELPSPGRGSGWTRRGEAPLPRLPEHGRRTASGGASDAVDGCGMKGSKCGEAGRRWTQHE